MTTPRLLRRAFAAALLFCACTDRLQAQTIRKASRLDTAAFAHLSDRELRIAVLTRLRAMESRIGQVAAAVGGSQGNLSFALQASACLQTEFSASTDVETGMTLAAEAEGHLGADIYGSGGQARVHGTAESKTVVVPAGGLKVQLQFCAQATPGSNTTFSRLVSGNSVAAAAVTGPAETMIRNLMASISTDLIAGAMSRLRMDGSLLGAALNTVSNFSLSDIQFGKGPASALIAAMPLPTDVADLLRSPSNIFSRATEGARFAIDRLCTQSIFTGEVAQKAQLACSLRNQMPSGQTLISILQGVSPWP